MGINEEFKKLTSNIDKLKRENEEHEKYIEVLENRINIQIEKEKELLKVISVLGQYLK